MIEATTTRRVDYFNLPRPLWRKLKKCLPKHTKKSTRRDGRLRASDRAVVNAIWYVLWTGCQWKALHREWFGVSSSVIHERFQRWRRMGLFEKLMKRMVEYYAKERGGVGWRWQAMDSKNSSEATKAISCYGLYLPRLEDIWIRFVDGRPVSSISTRFLSWCCEGLERVGKETLLLIWDNASPGTSPGR